jgi:hypothetical protein
MSDSRVGVETIQHDEFETQRITIGSDPDLGIYRGLTELSCASLLFFSEQRRRKMDTPIPGPGFIWEPVQFGCRAERSSWFIEVLCVESIFGTS